jgi:putative resolvase
VPAVRVNQRTMLVNPDSAGRGAGVGGVGWCARVFSHDHRDDLDRQVAGLSGWAANAGSGVVRVQAEARVSNARWVAHSAAIAG